METTIAESNCRFGFFMFTVRNGLTHEKFPLQLYEPKRQLLTVTVRAKKNNLGTVTVRPKTTT
jgi:hypothetical protein